MRIIFVRHGHPDYTRDCLTELGRRQALAAAERLAGEGVSRIFSSTKGRAMETAVCTAERLGLPVEPCPFMREVHWGSTVEGLSIPAAGHPWTLADLRVAAGEPLLDTAWASAQDFANNRLSGSAGRRESALDAWLAELGYVREDRYYRVRPGMRTDVTVAAFGHGGAGSVFLGRLFNLPLPFVCQAMGQDYTGITIVQLPDRPGELVAPRFELMNDARHIACIGTENIYGQ